MNGYASYESFKEDKEKAHVPIMLSISDRVLREVADEEIATSIWKKYVGLYMKKSLTNQLYLKQQLHNLEMKEDTPISEHLDESKIKLLWI